MVEIPKDHETALDIVWGAFHAQYDGWKHVFPNTHGVSRVDIAKELGWSYMTVWRLTGELVSRGQLIPYWNHQHQSYWEGLFKPSDWSVKNG